MAIFWTNSNLTNPIQSTNSVLQFSVPPGVRAITNVASRSSGAVTTTNVEYIFNSNRVKRNSASYSTTTGRFTATRAGVYMVYVWLMTNNAAIYNNRNWRIRINNSGDNRQVYSYSSNVTANHTNMDAAITVNLAVNDFISVLTDNMPLYGSNERYARFCVHYLG
jgi:restriction endonuclease S subunit